MRPSYAVELGNIPPKIDKLIQLIGIALLYFVGLSGSVNIIGKKCA